MRSTATFGFLLLAMSSPALNAQESSTWIPSGTALGVTFDRFEAADGFRLVAGTFHVSSIKPNNLTPEFAVSIFPRAIASRVLLTNIDLGGAFNIPMPSATMLIRGGVSGLFLLGGGGAGGIGGAHYGLSLLLKFRDKNGIRLDLLHRLYFLPIDLGAGAVTLGVGITALPGIH